MEKQEIVKFENGELLLEVPFTPESDNVRLNQRQISELFEIDRTVVGRHINNIFKSGELDRGSMCANFAHMGN